MKLIIEIPEEKYNDILRTHVNMRGIVDNAIAMGTPIPDNATNGDVMKIIFPKIGVYDEWYDEPYQKEDKNE